MQLPNYFTLECEKPDVLIFRKEGDMYITFDPVNLEYYKLNKTSTQIIYLISQNNSFEDIVCLLSKEYSVLEETLRTDIIEFIESFPCSSIIKKFINKGKSNEK